MNTLLTSSLITAALLSAPSFAADTGFGIFGAIGQAKHDFTIQNGSDTSFAIGGEYRFNSNFSIEARYDDYGTAEFRAYETDTISYPLDISGSSFGAGVKGIIPLNEQFSLLAKIGLASWELDAAGDEESGTDLYYGFGVQYMATEQFGLGLDYTMLDAEVEGGIDYELSNISLSASFYF